MIMSKTLMCATARATLALVITLATFFGATTRATEQDKRMIEKRAEEISQILPDGQEFGASAKPQALWDKFATLPSANAVIKSAEKLAQAPPPVITEELYKEFYANGNRANYQREFFQAQSRFINFAVAERLENKGRFIQPLDDAIKQFCALKSWVLPAHDAGAVVYDGKSTYSDLGAATAGGELAIAINLLRDKLPRETVELATREIERRVLAPYEKAIEDDSVKAGIGMWWVRTTNNWNAVCSAGTLAAALNLIQSKERIAYYIAATEYFSEKYFMKGFSSDGYCSEGMSYWNYGFGNYLYLGALARNATNGKVDFFRFDKIRAILEFAPNLEIDKYNYAVFADCPTNARPNATYVGYLSRLKGYGYLEFEEKGLGQNFGVGDLIQTTSIGYDEEIVFDETDAEASKYEPPIRTEFQDAGVVICRPNPNVTGKYFAIAFKGGTNAEMHNHNDVGSYSLLVGDNTPGDAKPDVYVSRDPGGETYTARTFSSRRYEGELLNSFGHPVPRIDGTLQSPGGESRGVFLEKSFTDELDVATLEITSAYKVPKLERATRKFEYRRAHQDEVGYLEIVDRVAFKEGETGAFETAIITFESELEFKRVSDSQFEIALPGASVRVDAKDENGDPIAIDVVKQIVGEKDPNVPKKPNRIAILTKEPVANATITQRFDVK